MSMSSEFVDLSVMSPVEAALCVEDRAAYLGRIIVGYDQDTIEEMGPVFENLDQGYPFMNKEVTVFGKIYTPILDEEFEILGGTFDDSIGTVRGMHLGFKMVGESVRMGDEIVDTVFRVVHIVHTDDDVNIDPFGQVTIEKNHKFILVEGAHVEPIDIEGVHSLPELRDDTVCEEIDAIVYDEELEPQQALELLEQLFVVPADLDQFDMRIWQQRISYLNSLGYLDNVTTLSERLSRSQNGNSELIYAVATAFTIDSPQRFEFVPEWTEESEFDWFTTNMLRLGVGGKMENGDWAACMLHLPFAAERSL